MPYFTSLKIILLLTMTIIGCSTDSHKPPVVQATLVSSHDLPGFIDDLGLDGLSVAVQRQLPILRKEHEREALRIGHVSYSTGRLLASLEQFNLLLSEADICIKNSVSAMQCSDTFVQKLRERFLIYRLKPSLLTAYYTPTIEVSTQQSGKFKYPIYRTPDTARERRYSREEIDFSHKFDSKGYEIYYAADLFDLYVVHIEGGARVEVNDNGIRYTRYLHYDTDNGLEFTNLDEYMINHGLLDSRKASRLDQRAVLAAHQDKVREIFSSCPGYVFFKVSDTPIIASTGATLTENRSLATDPAYYPVKGIVTYVAAPLPLPPAEGTPAESNPDTIQYRTMQRFFIDQDTGHHIVGPNRADLFFGEGPYAEFLGNNFMTMGNIYIFVLK